jgi:hypothetical protein
MGRSGDRENAGVAQEGVGSDGDRLGSRPGIIARDGVAANLRGGLDRCLSRHLLTDMGSPSGQRTERDEKQTGTLAVAGAADGSTRRTLYAVALVTLALMLWGMHGSASILHSICKDYWGPGSDPVARPSLIAGIAWDDELISFVFGALTCVALPAAVLRF